MANHPAVPTRFSPIRFSVVTISYNQARFLREAIESVLSQESEGIEIEYIVCDPGSKDDSRAIADSYGERIAHRVYERDDGPADGLNRGFARATGDVFCYINSDDYFLPGAFARVARFLAQRPDIDVVLGHGLAVDGEGKVLRRIWSEPFTRRATAYGAHVQVQPATFIRGEAWIRSGGFDAGDRCTWDSTLLDNLFLAGARFAVLDAFLGAFRLYPGTITASGSLKEQMAQSHARRFERLMGRPWRSGDSQVARFLRLAKHLRWPRRAIERWRYGPLFMREA